MSRQFKVPVNLVQLTTDPTTALAGDIYFNSTSSKIKFYSGTEWLEVGAGAGGGGTTNHTHDYNGNVLVGAGGSLVTTATFAAGVPNNSNGQNGDVYVDITNLDVYVKNSGTWGSPTEINAYTKSEVDTLLAGKSATGHTHTSSNITDFDEAAQDAVGNNVGTGLSYNDNTGSISVNTSTIQTRVSGVSDTEIGYLDGVTSGIQSQINSKASTGHTHTLSNITDVTASAAELNILDGVTVTSSEINYLSGLDSNVQNQLNNIGNSIGDYVPLSVVGFADGVAKTDSNGNVLIPTSPAGAGIKFPDNTIQTTAFNTAGFATSSQLSDVEVLALAGL